MECHNKVSFFYGGCHVVQKVYYPICIYVVTNELRNYPIMKHINETCKVLLYNIIYPPLQP